MEVKPEVSVVVPVKDEQETVEELVHKARRVLEEREKSFEIILVDDGSADKSFEKMKELAAGDGRVRAVRFLRNFGKSAALTAGFERASGRTIITIDADLQDDPEEIPVLLDELDKGYHLVSGWKKERQDPLGKRFSSRLANLVTSVLSGVRVHDMNCGFKAYRHEVIRNLRIYGDLHRFIPALAGAQGFTVSEVVVRHHPRRFGKSKYGLARMPRGFFDLLTVLFITQYARRPLHLFGGIGVTLGFLGFAALLYLTCIWFIPGHDPIGTRPLFMGGIMLMILGAQLLSLGLVGELITHNSFRASDQYAVLEETDHNG
ncbi:MAG: glycosyltransferase family 2 protein [bacterium]